MLVIAGKDVLKGTVSHPSCCQKTSHLEPVNGAAVDQGWVLAQAVPEGIANGAEAQHHMQALLALLHKEAPQFHRALQPKLASSWPHHLQHLPTAQSAQLWSFLMPRLCLRSLIRSMITSSTSNMLHVQEAHTNDNGRLSRHDMY